MCIMMIILFAAVLVLLWKNYRIKKEAKLFAEKVEGALDAIVTGKEWNMEEELEDSLWGRTGTQLAKAGHVFQKKEEEGFREKERVKGLISDISHQTRTPIANIKLYLELLEDEEFSQSGQEFLGKIKGQMEKIDFLMQSMVKMSRLETGILQIHKEDQNLYETIRHAVADVVPEAALKGIGLYVNCEENMMIRHDSKWTEEAIYNILDNALKYTESGGSIHIEVQKQELFYNSQGDDESNLDYRSKYMIYLAGGQFPVSGKWYCSDDELIRERNVTILPVIRATEMQYIMAEYYAREQNYVEAYRILNEIRSDRGCVVTIDGGASWDGFVKELILDARREWISEGQLFYLYKRLNADIEFNRAESRPLKREEYLVPVPADQFL